MVVEAAAPAPPTDPPGFTLNDMRPRAVLPKPSFLPTSNAVAKLFLTRDVALVKLQPPMGVVPVVASAVMVLCPASSTNCPTVSVPVEVPVVRLTDSPMLPAVFRKVTVAVSLIRLPTAVFWSLGR